MITLRYTVMFLTCLEILFLHSFSFAETMSQAGTETNCNFGMAKGQKSASCKVPIPSGCTVAKFPGFDQHWADVSKGGKTNCRFDEEKSDWKTTIVGTCDTCKTDQCSARFSVKFNCTSTMTPPKMQRPAH